MHAAASTALDEIHCRKIRGLDAGFDFNEKFPRVFYLLNHRLALHIGELRGAADVLLCSQVLVALPVFLPLLLTPAREEQARHLHPLRVCFHVCFRGQRQ